MNKKILLAICILGLLWSCSSKKVKQSSGEILKRTTRVYPDDLKFPNTKPYFIGDGPEIPSNKAWVPIAETTDEFNQGTFNKKKWHADPRGNGWGWIGRKPGLFEAKSITVKDGNLNVTTEKYTKPKVVNGTTYTHGGGIVRSWAPAGPGRYYECRMKANKTIMSSTFWISFKQNCNQGPKRKLELDIQECVGRVHKGTHKWAKKWDNIFHSNIFRHFRECDEGADTKVQNSKAKNLEEKNHSRYFVYGCWWKSPTEIHFYLDGEYAYSIETPTPYNIEGNLTMAIETYDWNPVDPAGSIFETASWDDRTTKYDWIRTWELK